MLDLLFVALMQAAAGDPAVADPQATAPAAQTEAAPAVQTASEQVDSGNVRRCRVETYTGSRLGARVCATARERQERENDTREFLRRAQTLHDNQGG